MDDLDDFADFERYGDVPAPRYGSNSFADELLDDVLPEAVDWRRWVARYPAPVLLAAALGGFFLGRRRGKAVMTAAVAFAADRLAHGLSDTLGSAQFDDDLEDDRFDEDFEGDRS
jgi:hypothetical protein